MTFAELWQESRARHAQPGEQQAWLRSELPRRLTEAGLRLATPGSRSPNRIVVGIADHVRDELAMLDQICATSLPVFEVFLLTSCTSSAEVQSFVPTGGPVHQSPVVGVWKSGVLRAAESGFAGRELLQQILREYGTTSVA